MYFLAEGKVKQQRNEYGLDGWSLSCAWPSWKKCFPSMPTPSFQGNAFLSFPCCLLQSPGWGEPCKVQKAARGEWEVMKLFELLQRATVHSSQKNMGGVALGMFKNCRKSSLAQGESCGVQTLPPTWRSWPRLAHKWQMWIPFPLQDWYSPKNSLA